MTHSTLPIARLSATVCLLGLLTRQPASSQTYTITELPPLAGENTSAAYAINEGGYVAGHSNYKAVIWANGAPRNIQTLPVPFSVARALNDSGFAAGDTVKINNSEVFFWNGYTMESIRAPAGQFTLFDANGINNAGIIAGFGGNTRAFLWQGGVFFWLPPLAGSSYANALAINNLNVVVGYSASNTAGPRATLWSNMSPAEIPLPSGTNTAAAFGINDRSEVVGWYTAQGFRRPFIWSQNLGTVSLPLSADAAEGYAIGINSAGVVIGATNTTGAAIWRKGTTGVYEIVSIASLLSNGSGWEGIVLRSINDAGQIAGDGRLNGEMRGFILSPGPTLSLTLRVDLDRSGTTDFTSTSDATTLGDPFYFWTNDDHDATGEELPSGVPDSADVRIMPLEIIDGVEVLRPGAIRDLEDFARLAFALTPEIKTALEAGATLSLEAQGAGTIRLFAAPSDGAESRYLTDEAFAQSLVLDPATNIAIVADTVSEGGSTWQHLEQRITPVDWESGRLRFLWEGVTPGACVLTLKLIQPDGVEVASAPVHISLRPVRDFFERVRATPADGFAPPWDTNGQTPAMSWEQVHPKAVTLPGEQNVDLVWVHGWRLTEYERQNWAEIMFKRLWHAGYRGRLRAFTWPTFSGDDSFASGFLTFDKSEHRAWKSGAALESYLRTLRAEHSGGRLVVTAHSMGNIVTGEAFRRDAPADLQIMMQAAVSAGCYDARTEIDEPELIANERKDSTPDLAVSLGYRDYLAPVSVPTVNFHNQVDYALQTGREGIPVNWFDHQEDKPYNPNGRGTYGNTSGIPGLYAGKKLLREVMDPHESMAFIARSRTRAVGAQALSNHTMAGQPLRNFVGRVDLQQAFQFTSHRSEHSAQFNRPIQRLMVPFYATIIDISSPTPLP